MPPKSASDHDGPLGLTPMDPSSPCVGAFDRSPSRSRGASRRSSHTTQPHPMQTPATKTLVPLRCEKPSHGVYGNHPIVENLTKVQEVACQRLHAHIKMRAQGLAEPPK